MSRLLSAPELRGGLAAALLLALAATATAQSLRVRCDTFPNRSRASVDGSELVVGAAYTAVLVSGSNRKESPAQDATAAGEAQFDFDSNPADIRGGATPIKQHFIVGNQVTGRLKDAAGNVVASQTRTCRQH